VAERYSDQAHIIGYDLINEPFMGSGAEQILPAMLQAYAELLVSEGQEPPPTMEELAQMWSSEAERNKVYEKIVRS
jgi:endoglycosylceramidase